MANLKFTIDVCTDGDAFQPDATAAMERVFDDVVSAVFHDETFGRGLDSEVILFDVNGNRCGRVRLVYETEPTPLYDGNRDDTRTCECGAPRVHCPACGVWRFACAACPCGGSE